MATLERDGVQIHYSIHGIGRSRAPILLTHGFGASGAMWDPNLEALTEARRVLTWDMRGHARSEAPEDPQAYGLEQTLGDMRFRRRVVCGAWRLANAGGPASGHAVRGSGCHRRSRRCVGDDDGARWLRGEADLPR